MVGAGPGLGKIGVLERMFAPFHPLPVHERRPARRRPARRLSKLAFHVLLAPLSLAGRIWFLLTGRSRPLEPSAVRTMAFVKLDHLGDALMAIPLMRALKEWSPSARLVVYTGSLNAGVVSRLPFVDEVVETEVPWVKPDSTQAENLGACFSLADRIRSRNFDLVVDLRYHNRLDSLLLSLCGARWRLGHDAGGFGFGVTHRAPVPRKGHEMERGARALARFGIPVRDMRQDFPLLPGEELTADIVLSGSGRVVAFHPGAGNPVKRWMPGRFAWVARELARRARVKIAVLAGPGEEELAEPIAEAVPPGSLLDLRGKLSVTEMAAVMKRTLLVVGNDGGPAHVAAAVGAPVLVVFSGTSVAAEWAPRGRHVRVIEKWIACKPCHSADCPFSQDCLRAVKVNEVVRTALRIVKGGKVR